jgi:hypothetical protein
LIVPFIKIFNPLVPNLPACGRLPAAGRGTIGKGIKKNNEKIKTSVILNSFFSQEFRFLYLVFEE